MKALLLTQYRHLEIADMPQPEVGPSDVLVRVAACGICGSDIHGFDGSSGRRIPPLVMGHEAAGEVVRVGPQVSRVAPGMRVTFDSTVCCGDCFFCRRGDINLCDHRQVLGVSCGQYRRHGAFAEFVCLPQQIVYPLPDSVPLEHATLIEPLSVAMHGVRRAEAAANDAAVVVGTGMIGLLVVQALKRVGCRPVIAVDLDADRLERAADLGADLTLLAQENDVPQCVRQATGGRGADVAIEAVGASQPMRTAIAALRKGGRLALVGNITPQVEIPLQEVVTRELTLAGSCAARDEIPQCIGLLANGDIIVAPLITAAAPLEDGPRWFDRLYGAEAGQLKVVLRP